MTKTELKTIPVNKILANFSQPRESFDREKTKELAESILSNGLINPITIRKWKGDKFMIVSGERRWQAHKIVGLKTIQAFVKEYKSNGQIAVESLIENVHRENLKPIERARYLKKIADMEKIYYDKDGKGFLVYKKGDVNIKALAKRVKMNEDTIRQDLSLLGFEPRDIKDISRRSLVRIATVDDERTKRRILNLAKGKNSEEIDKIVSVTRKSPKEIKEAILKEEIEPEVAEEIIEIKEPEVQRKVFEEVKKIQKKNLKATPEKIKEIKEEIDLLKGWHNLRLKKTPEDFVNMITNNLMKINDLMPSNPRKISFIVQVLSSDEYKSYGKGLLKTLDNTLKRNILPFYKELKNSLE